MNNDVLQFHEAQRCLAAGDVKRAEELCDDLVERTPEHVAAWRLLADSLAAQGRDDDAEDARVEADSVHADHLRMVAAHAFEQRLYASAAECYRRALQLDPDDPDTVWWLAESLHYDGDDAQAIDWYRKFEAQRPGHPEAVHMIAAIGRAEVPERASHGYVCAVFDSFAESFDDLLTGELEYKAPELLFEAVEGVLPPDGPKLNVLDLGCGTGLSGIRFRPYARRLQGVDLSREMIRQARWRGIYDSLRVMDVAQSLAAFDGRLDLVIACDVLIYIGELRTLFEAAGRALAPGGLLAVTTEYQSEPGYSLGPSGRYRHGVDYLHECAAAAGLAVVSESRVVLRLEQGEPVEGQVGVYRRPA